MSSRALFSVIRYMPDPGRGERLNVGVLVWTDDDFRLQIDQKAVQRVIRENPRLERDSLLYLDPSLHASLTADTPVREKVETLLAEQKGFPTDFTEPRFTTVGDAGGLDQALEDLVGRVVRPKRRYGGAVLPPCKQSSASYARFWCAVRLSEVTSFSLLALAWHARPTSTPTRASTRLWTHFGFRSLRQTTSVRAPMRRRSRCTT